MGAPELRTVAGYAEAYAARGLAVFPLHTPVGSGCSCGAPDCRNAGKHPRIGNGFHAATNSVAQVREWWAKWPDANIGCVPGRSRHLVIDIDGPDGELTASRMSLLVEPTLEVSSGREDGGRHRWYHHPGGEIGNVPLGRGIDVRADGGYVILPPSLHRSGKRYKWLGRWEEIARLPTGILEALRGTKGMVITDRKPAAMIPLEPIRDGERNSSLARYAGRMFWTGASEAEVVAVIRGLNATNCTPPLDDAEVLQLVASIGRREASKPARTTSTGVPIGIVGDAPAAPEETLDTVAAAQTVDAQALLDVDRSGAPRWCWRGLHKLSGVMLPGELHVVGALMGNGKTSFLMTQMDAFARAKVGVLYIPLEIDPKLCRVRWAAWRTGLDPVKVLRGEWGGLPPESKDVIRAELAYLGKQHHIHFTPDKRITLPAIRSWCERAKGDAGVEVVMVDHLHRLSIGAHAEQVRVHLSETVRGIADMLRELELVGIAAAQLNRSGDTLDAFYPPGIDRLKESAAIGEEAWTVHMLSRRLLGDTSPGQVTQARQGKVDVASLEDPGVMVVTNRKDRLAGAATNRSIALAVNGGKVEELAPDWRPIPEWAS